MARKSKDISQICVIGLGRFGTALVKCLIDMGKEVMAIDVDEAKVHALTNIATSSAVADATDEQVLKELDIVSFDAVVICIGENLQNSTLVTIMCKELGAKYVVSKASTETHKKILKKLGADLVVVPEIDSGRKLASTLTHPMVSDVLELTPNYLLAEVLARPYWENKKLSDLDFRKNYGINIIIIKRNGSVILNPDGFTEILNGDILIVGGSTNIIDNFFSNLT